jgi:hypothetical protein
MKINELLTESTRQTVTLSGLYSGDYPDRDEMFWDYVSQLDLNRELEVQTLSPNRLNILLLSQYRAEHIDEIVDMLDEEQAEIVDEYRTNPNLPNSIIVVANNRIIDGNHRALAAALNNSPIKYVDLDEDED